MSRGSNSESKELSQSRSSKLSSSPSENPGQFLIALKERYTRKNGTLITLQDNTNKGGEAHGLDVVLYWIKDNASNAYSRFRSEDDEIGGKPEDLQQTLRLYGIAGMHGDKHADAQFLEVFEPNKRLLQDNFREDYENFLERAQSIKEEQEEKAARDANPAPPAL